MKTNALNVKMYDVVIFYGFETLNETNMNIKRIEEIQKDTAYPDSISVQQALLKVWNECEREKVVKSNAVLPPVGGLLPCHHNFIQKDTYWKSCTHCGMLAPLGQ